LTKVTRRDFFRECCSRDTIKTVLGSWYGFTKEVNNTKNEFTCDEAAKLFGRKLKKNQIFSNLNGKEG
jgi:hypothetical protein